jgi:prepilin-type N-terminal cleavage/methylation domain-containing protein
MCVSFRKRQTVNEQSQKLVNSEKGVEMNRLRLRSEGGFTLIELLVVVAIIGILAAIAIPQFAAYRKRGYEATMKADIRNAATAEEAYYAQNQTYKTGSLASWSNSGYNKSADILTITATAASNVFTITATHSNCATTASWSFQSSNGQITGTAC